MGNFADATLGDVIELKRGYDLPRQDRAVGSIPIVSSSGITDYNSRAMARGPGVITGRYGTLGLVFYVAEDFGLSIRHFTYEISKVIILASSITFYSRLIFTPIRTKLPSQGSTEITSILHPSDILSKLTNNAQYLRSLAR